MKNSARFFGWMQGVGRLKWCWSLLNGKMWILTLLLLMLCSTVEGENPLTNSKRILFINSYAMSHNWTRTLSVDFNNYFLESKENVLVDVVELCALTNLGNRLAEPNFDWVEDKISSGDYDLIAVADYPAFDFISSRLAAVPKGLPVVFCGGIERSAVENLPLENKSGLLRPQNSLLNIELGLALYPSTRVVAIITDATLEGRRYNEYFKSLTDLPGDIRLNLINGSDVSTAAMLSQVAGLPPESFVVYFNWKSAIPEDFQTFGGVADKLAAVSPGPVFCVNDSYLNNGFLGGFLTPGEDLGAACGRLCENILLTESRNAAQFPILYSKPELIINYPVYEKFSPVQAGNLPGNVIFRNRVPGFFAVHFVEILIFAIVILFLGSWCTFLLIRRRYLIRSKTIFSHMPVRVVVCDRKGKICFHHNCDNLRAEHDSACLKDLPYDLANKFADTLNNVFASGEKMEQEYSDSYGKRRAYFSKLPTRVFGRETVMWVSIDTNQLAQTQAELEASFNFLNITLRSIGDGVIVTDENGIIKICNSVAEELTQYLNGSSIGRSCNEVFNIVSYQDDKPIESPVEKALRTNSVVKLANHTDLIARD
ncbi:MAG: PAS domain-containing protein, partial [Victivallaceae bacterium]